MIPSSTNKVSASHLQRAAFLYVRQSTLKQVVENTESTKRQYALRDRARALGWKEDQVVVVDVDLGKSGASSADREGFQQLVAQVSLGKAGIVLGLEVSRLARNNADWHRLLEICAITDTLILDEEGIYNPRDFNDRLLLGLKGTMSEAELHLLRARLRGGILNKARRGELKMALPIGFAHDKRDHIVKDPDQRIQQTVELFFSIFQQSGSASAIVKHFNDNKLLFPRRLRGGVNRGDVIWGPLIHTRALQILHHPIYAGAYSFGRNRVTRNKHGRLSPVKLPQDQWTVLIPDAHEAYISFVEFEQNVQTLRSNAKLLGSDRLLQPPGEGPALLQGLIVCANCGRRMTVRYHTRKGQRFPTYVCQADRIGHGAKVCQTIPGAPIDGVISQLLLKEMTSASLAISLQVEQELKKRQDQTSNARLQAIEQLRYETQLAQRRYLQVDPDNRLVAAQLESEWNESLTNLQQAQDEHQRSLTQNREQLNQKMRLRIQSLVEDFPRLWNDPKTPQKERKRMVRLLLEDVTVLKADQLMLQIRFKGGALRSITTQKAKSADQIRKTDPMIVDRIDKLLDELTPKQIAAHLNEQNLSSGTNRPFSLTIINRIRRTYSLKSRYDRLRERGLISIHEIAKRLNVCTSTVKVWRNFGLLEAQRYDDKKQCLYKDPGQNAPKKLQGLKFPLKSRKNQLLTETTNEVHHEV